MDELITKVEQWAKDKGLDQTDSSKQMLKTIEEIGEVAASLARKDEHGLRDGIGDVVVTLIILAMQNDMDLYECLNQAYNEIKGRTGKMVDGVFVKSSDLKQLDEPQKPVVPKFVADWIELCKEKADLISCLSGSYEYGVNQYKRITEDEDWLFEADHQELVARAWLYGYEIEKEPLYTVTINLDRKYHLVVDEGDGNDEISTTLTTSHGVLGYRYFLTEKEIKSADENLWLIAVPVEEVAEG